MAVGVAPFRYEEPLEPDELVDREDELSGMLARVEAGRNTRLSAPRRFGKTSLLRRLLRDAERQGVTGVYVDFYGVLTAADVAARLERAYEEALRGPLARWFSGVRRAFRPVGRVSAGPAAVEIASGPTGPADAQGALLERLAMPRRLADRTGGTVLVVFDEFQALLGAGDQIDAVFRSEIQHHGDRVAYVFAGSHPGMMRELFSASRPFFDQAAPVVLGPLPDEALAEHIGATFEHTEREIDGVLDPLLALARGHPQRAMQLAAHAWLHTPPGGSADGETWDLTLESAAAEVDDAFRARWDALASSYRRALSAIAAGDVPLLSRSAQAAHGTSPGATGKAVSSLVTSGDIQEDIQTATGWRIIDPLWERWIANGRGSR